MEHSSKESYEMHAIIRGHVQGVGFRALTHYRAIGLGLTGSVRNLSDGTVEIYAQGSKQRLEELIQHLKEEMAPGQIEETTIQYFPIDKTHENFRILN
jgi:acylphosphatase